MAKIIYVWRALPDCLLWVLKLILPWAPDDLEVYPRFNAEKAIEAPEMGVAWDYAAFIIHISTAFLVASVVSSSVCHSFEDSKASTYISQESRGKYMICII